MECDSFVRIFMTPLLKVICSIHKPVLVGWFRDVIDKDMSYQQENVPIPEFQAIPSPSFVQRTLLRKLLGTGPEVALKALIHSEGSSSGIHTTQVLGAANVLQVASCQGAKTTRHT